MAINDLISTRNSRYSRTTDPSDILLIALGEIQSELQKLSLNIKVADPDFSSLESAINNLRDGFPGPVPPQNLDLNPVLRSYEDTARAIKELLGEVKSTNTRIAHIGGGGGSNINPQVLQDIKRRISDTENRLDYSTRTDANPVYVGKATQGTLTSSPTWTIQLLEYDISDRLIRTQVITGAWDDRTSLDWT